MKKSSIVVIVIMSVSSLTGKWKWFEKNIAKPVQKIVKNPKKVAAATAKEAVKTTGINIDNITKEVQKINATIGNVQKDIGAVQTSLNAPQSPMKKGPIIANKVADFQTKARSVIKQLNVDDIKKALSNASALGVVLQKLTSDTVQKNINALYKSYEGLLTEIDSVQLAPILGDARKMVLNIATIIDLCVKIRGHAGQFAKKLVSGKLVTALGGIAKNLRLIAGDLRSIERGGFKSLRSVQAELAASLISNLGSLEKLVGSIKQTSTEIPPLVKNIVTEVNKMQTIANALISRVTNLPNKLQKMVDKRVKAGIAVFDIPRAAIKEIGTLIIDLRKKLDTILQVAANTITIAADIMQKGVSGIDAFKTDIKFDIITSRSRTGVMALTSDMQGLATAVTALRGALPKGPMIGV